MQATDSFSPSLIDGYPLHVYGDHGIGGQVAITDGVLKYISTDPGDTIYDNSGSFVSRPHAYFMYYTDAGIRKSQATKLANEVPREILSNQTVAELRDMRFKGLPASLTRFLQAHFQPYSGDIRLWGARYGVPWFHPGFLYSVVTA